MTNINENLQNSHDNRSMTPLKEYQYSEELHAGLFIGAGGFEDRALTFSKKISDTNSMFDNSLVLKYESQFKDNEENLDKICQYLTKISKNSPKQVPVNLSQAISSFHHIQKTIETISQKLENSQVYIDISGMTHIFAIASIHSCVSCGLKTNIIFTEARNYFPTKKMSEIIIKSWQNNDYDVAYEFLQSKGLKNVVIPPVFSGNYHPSRQTCLLIFVGYEPNRIQGLMNSYSPGKIIVYYGESPHDELKWRTDLSKKLHHNIFSNWAVHESIVDTLDLNKILTKLKDDYLIIRDHFDFAIAPQNSKMQTIASYLFWREHPEIQLIFTIPASFNKKYYSKGSRRTYIYPIYT